jgi:multiple sugar transport system permease protein
VSAAGATRRDPGLAFVGPFLLIYCLVLILPALHGIWLSLHIVDIWGDGRFAGLANYARLFADPVFGQSLVNTFVVTLMVVPILTVIALALALALNRASRGAACCVASSSVRPCCRSPS